MIPQLITEPIYHADEHTLDEDYEYGSFTQSKMFEKLVKCSDCHDSHSVRTKEPDNQLCLQCHRPDIYLIHPVIIFISLIPGQGKDV